MPLSRPVMILNEVAIIPNAIPILIALAAASWGLKKIHLWIDGNCKNWGGFIDQPNKIPINPKTIKDNTTKMKNIFLLLNKGAINAEIDNI